MVGTFGITGAEAKLILANPAYCVDRLIFHASGSPCHRPAQNSRNAIVGHPNPSNSAPSLLKTLN